MVVAFVYEKNITNLSQRRKATQRNKINSAILCASARENRIPKVSCLLSAEDTKKDATFQ